MNPAFGWALAALAVAAGWAGWGLPGVVLAITVITFWLMLQFSRALRVMRMAAGRPVGHVDSAVMLNSKLAARMTMMQVIPLTRSLGERVGGDDTWRWVDTGGDRLTLRFERGRLAHWSLERAGAAATSTDRSPPTLEGRDGERPDPAAGTTPGT
jgi:hypothetical protein